MSRLISVSPLVLSVRFALALALGAGVFSTGCSQPPEPGSGPRVAVFPVSGKVQIEGDSPSGAVVVFHSVSKTTPPASATVDSEGRFKLTTYETGDGAPAGEYSVTVSLRKLVTKDGDSITGPNVLPAKFASPTTTPFKVTVAAAPNELKPFVVTK